jgi:hypothetical protein
MALDQRGRIAGNGHGLDDVGIQRALREKLARPARLVARLKTSMNVRPMILRLRSGSVTPLSLERNSFEAFSYCNLILKCRRKLAHDLRLARAQQAVVDENAGELVADGLVQQRRRHARIHAAAQAENDLFLADLRADFLDGLFDVIAHRPFLPQPQMLWTKLAMISRPRGVWTTSG